MLTVGNTITQWLISLPVAPSNLTDPTSNVTMERNEGEPLTLSCTARGYPRPTITWSPGSGEHIIIFVSTSTDVEGYLVVTSNLMISSIAREDAGIYTCTSSNTYGVDTHSFNLTVYCKLLLIAQSFSYKLRHSLA